MSTLATSRPGSEPCRTIGNPSRASADEAVVVDPRTGHDEAVDVLGAEEGLVRPVDGVKRLDHHPEPGARAAVARPRSVSARAASPATCSGDWRRTKPRVWLLPPARTPGRGMGVIAELGRGQQHPLARRWADVRARPVVQNERHGRPRDACLGRHIGTRRPPSRDGHSNSGQGPDRLGSLPPGDLTERPGRWRLTRVSDAYYYSVARRSSTL